MYAVYMPNMCSKVADIYTVKKWGVQHTLIGVPHASLKLSLRVYRKGVYVPSRV